MPDTCSTCRFWDDGDKQALGLPGEGVCRRYAPRPSAVHSSAIEDFLVAVWPNTAAGETCGDYSRRPSNNTPNLI